MDYCAGSLVRVHNRDWVVQPSTEKELLLLKPLGGSEDELTGIYLPFAFPDDQIESTQFPLPTENDIGDLATARLLFNSARLAIRNGAGPFRSLGKLSFRPRSYQMVPLIMALRQPSPIRLLIADDVGVGKTIEALLVLKELLERRQIERFAVIALPHLCDQWQAELQQKFGIDAVVIRSNTQARLDRQIFGDTSVFQYYPFQVISIDYIKSDQRRQVFINECPELIIVDEAHSCANLVGSGSSAQQQRYALIRDIAAKPKQNVILLTATPHSGKQEQFQSLLGLLDSKFANLDVPSADRQSRERLARHFIQRRRSDVAKWLEETLFPERESGEVSYQLSVDYSELYDQVFDFSMALVRGIHEADSKARMRYWSALALLRGVMSSPAAGADMLANRLLKAQNDDDQAQPIDNPILDEDFDQEKDFPSSGVINKTDWNRSEVEKLQALWKKLQELQTLQKDHKAATAVRLLKEWLEKGFHPIVFCRYIATANYLGQILKPELADRDELDVQVVTSEDDDQVRKQRIDEMLNHRQRLLIATDCLSEGINLQDGFTAVLHYDLPWNPNRLEQREGRIDRFGQKAPRVLAYLLYGQDNPIDGVVLKVLLEKVRQIRKDIGITIPFPEDSKSLMDSVLQAVILKGRVRLGEKQIGFDFFDQAYEQAQELKISNEFNKAAEREKLSRSIFAQHSIREKEIEQDLKQADQAIGDPRAVESLVTQGVRMVFGVQIDACQQGYELYTANLPDGLKQHLPDERRLRVSFYSPTPEGFVYLGRNHPFVEQLCRMIFARAMQAVDEQNKVARAAVIRCRDVEEKTTLLLFRVRNVIEDKQSGRQIVAEEVLPFGYTGNAAQFRLVEIAQAEKLLFSAKAAENLTPDSVRHFFRTELNSLEQIAQQLGEVAFSRAEMLVEAHERFRR
ncbi:DEAD/DEAH box helicase, partial [candidate division KSB1 bacterium]|nr:DEAD/DEAH box helicase [candidate division KSB1 bacterium]